MSAVYGILPKIAGALVGLSALAYVAGWKQASAYYVALGAPWAISLLSPNQIVQESIGLVSAIGIAAFLSVILLLNESVTVQSLRRWSLYLMLGGGFLLFAGLMQPWIGSFAVFVCYELAGLMCALAVGLYLGELIGDFAENDLRWSGGNLWLLYSAAIVGLLLIPRFIGQARAELDIHPELSKLPLVQFSGSHSLADRWQLIKILSDHALIAQLGGKPEERIFRIVAITEINAIRANNRFPKKSP